MVREILLLGDPRLYEESTALRKEEAGEARRIAADLKDTLADFRRKHGFGRAIAAPQIGEFRRIIYMEADSPEVIVNPIISFPDEELMEVMDDCMCFPGLLVRLIRHRRCRVDFLDASSTSRVLELEGNLSELVQHEYDHLNGILATMRAADGRAFSMMPRPQVAP